MTVKKWARNYKTKTLQTYPAIVGSIQTIDPVLIKFVEKGAGRIGSCGFTQSEGSVIFTSNSERDIHDVFKNQCWQNGNRPKGLKSGMSYLGCETIQQLHNKNSKGEIKYNLVTSIGMSENGIRVKTY